MTKSTGLRLATALVGFGAAASFWSAGLIVVPAPAALGALLATAGVSGALTLATAGPRLAGALLGAGRATARGVLAESTAFLAAAVTLLALAHPLASLFLISSEEVGVKEFARGPVPPARELRVVSFNIRHGFPDLEDQETRFWHAVEAFRKLDPAVIVLQESWRTSSGGCFAERLARILAMNVAYARANGCLRFLGFEEGSAILSRYPISRARRLVLPPRTPIWESRIALVAALDVGAGEELEVVGTHLSNARGSVAARQALALADRVPEAEIVAGDFNAGSASEAVAPFARRGMIDTVPGGIDHVLVDLRRLKGWRLARARRTLRPSDMERLVGRRVTLSDHPAYLVDLERGAPLRELERRRASNTPFITPQRSYNRAPGSDEGTASAVQAHGKGEVVP